jgi:hypothetical protein
LYHYCIMTNHLHFLLQLDDPRQLSGLRAGLLLPTYTTSTAALVSWGTCGKAVVRVQ